MQASDNGMVAPQCVIVGVSDIRVGLLRSDLVRFQSEVLIRGILGRATLEVGFVHGFGGGGGGRARGEVRRGEVAGGEVLDPG